MKNLLFWLAKQAGITTDYHTSWSCNTDKGNSYGDAALTVKPWIDTRNVKDVRGYLAELADESLAKANVKRVGDVVITSLTRM